MRISRDDYFMSLAKLVASRSTCDRASVGAVAVRDNCVIASGYNGSPSGSPHCDTHGHILEHDHCVRTIHAEQRIITNCAKLGTVLEGAIIYVTHFPCENCSKLLYACGIKEIIYEVPYYDILDDNYYANMVPTRKLQMGDIN